MIPHRVRLATVLAFGLHGMLILAARYRFSSDAYTHMLFADHYRTNWWSLWDPRWYTGFMVTSYPPLVHQVIALIGLVVGVDAAYAILLWAVLAAFPLAVYAFSRIFVGQVPAEYAALGAAVMPSIYLAAYAFGQLPTLTATLLALFCAAVLAEFLKTGRWLSWGLAVMLIASGMAAHHATLLFLPVMVASVALHLLLNKQVSWQKLLVRLAVFSLPAVLGGLLVIWPFWTWGMGQVMQTPIDHATRHNYITDLFSAFLFFWSVYGPLVAVIPFALRKIVERRYVAQSTAVGLLVLLGLGGTTPVPHWLFGPGWAWLTYDRFALWASFLLLPFLGEIVMIARQKLYPWAQRLSDFFLAVQIPLWSSRIKPALLYFSARLPQAIIYLVMAGISALVSFYPTMLPMQPRTIDMQPIVNFLAQGDRAQWRYLTFGFGDQFGYLNRLTTATTIDGSYHTARSLPELRSSGIGSIDASYWLPDGLEKLASILQIAGKYGVRWGFVDDTKYDAVLLQNGWDLLKVLSNGVQVWTNTKPVLPATSSPPPDNPLASFSWGTLPLVALAMTAGLAGLRLRPDFARRMLLQVHTLAIGLLPIGLVFWYFHSITAIQYERVYFIYDNALFYISDGLALTAVLAWALARGYDAAPRNEKRPFSFGSLFQSLTPWIVALCGLASLSVLWSKDWRITVYVSLHLWLGFGLYLSLRHRPDAWRAAAKGLCAALAIQVIFGFFEFVIQSTSWMAAMQMVWPGVLDPATPGASVVQLADGTRWLRAYGTLPHPNILGTFAVALLSGPALLFLTSRKLSVWAAILFTAGPALLMISFSRAAWLGFLAAGLVVGFKYTVLRRTAEVVTTPTVVTTSVVSERRRLVVLAACAVLGVAAAVYPLRSLVFSRVSATPSSPTENFSLIGRAWLDGQALVVMRQHPLLGIGAGTFVVNLSQHAGIGYIIEPAHNLFLLISSELGVGGALILIGLVLTLMRGVWIARATHSPQAVLFGAALVGLCVTGLFDHSLWTLAPSRLLLFLCLGLYAGQVENASP